MRRSFTIRIRANYMPERSLDTLAADADARSITAAGGSRPLIIA
jgi:hypothetical protein